MKCFSRLLLAASLSAAMVLPGAAADKSNSPAPATYLMTNDDGVLHSYVSFFSPGMSLSDRRMPARNDAVGLLPIKKVPYYRRHGQSPARRQN